MKVVLLLLWWGWEAAASSPSALFRFTWNTTSPSSQLVRPFTRPDGDVLSILNGALRLRSQRVKNARKQRRSNARAGAGVQKSSTVKSHAGSSFAEGNTLSQTIADAGGAVLHLSSE